MTMLHYIYAFYMAIIFELRTTWKTNLENYIVSGLSAFIIKVIRPTVLFHDPFFFLCLNL